MLHERSQHAQAVADVYMIGTDLIRMLSEDSPFQVSALAFPYTEELLKQKGLGNYIIDILYRCDK